MFIPDRDKYLGTIVVDGQHVLLTNSAEQLTSLNKRMKNGIIVQALAANIGIVKIGGTSTPYYELQAGQATSLAIDDVTKVYVQGSVGDGVCYISTI